MDNLHNSNNPNIYNELLKSIEHWNEYRVPILRISQPDKNLNFQGAMRFYFQDAGQKVATKCVNVTSADTTKDVIDVLINKFRPDMRMLSVPEYGLYEIHENGEERKLELDERPLAVQLEWNKDDREGRFLLRKMDEKTRDLAAQNEEPSLKRKLSKKEKKKQDKVRKQQQKEQEKVAAADKNGIAERLYNELPENIFTRTVSNPEAVMKRRRDQKLQKRLHEFAREGGQEAGGTLRIFGESINKDVSYKTLLLSSKDTASYVVKQILEKYGKDNEDPNNYCLLQLILPHSATSGGGDNNSVRDLSPSSAPRESFLNENDCPLLINRNHDKSKGLLTFHIKPKPADYHKRCKKKQQARGQQNPLHPLVVQQLNQRIQMNNNLNNNSEQYRDQNSPQNSSNSLNHDANNPPPPPFETVHSMPTMFSPAHDTSNVLPMYQQQQHQLHSMSASNLPPRFNNHQPISNGSHMSGTLQRQAMSHQNMNFPTNRQQFAPNPMVPIPPNHFPPVHHSQHQPSPISQAQFIQSASANDQILPALIQVQEDVEDVFLDNVVTQIDLEFISDFRLAPTFALYMVSRYRASTLFHPELQAPSRAELFVPFTKKIAALIRETIEYHMRDSAYLACWLANSSDLSHFYKQDKHLSHFTLEAQGILNDSIKASFRYFLACKYMELTQVLPYFFDEMPDLDDQDSTQATLTRVNGSTPARGFRKIIDILNETMAKDMRHNRVHAALTIQIFSHLFHFISKWLFDRLIGAYDHQATNMVNGQKFAPYCNRVWGERLNKRLEMIGVWAEKHGLEQAAEFHLARVTQVTLFLAKRYPDRISPVDLRKSLDSYDRLNPVQKRSLLQRYQPDSPTVRAIIQNILYEMDYSYMSGDYPLEEDPELKIPFLIPDDMYLSENCRFIPEGLLKFVSFLSKLRVADQELCIFTVQPTSCGRWTVYFKNHQPDTPEVIVIQLRKKNNSMGLSIMAAKGVGQDRLGVYIKSVVKNGAAAMDGRLQAGDQLLEVDGNSLLNINQEKAAELLQRTAPVVTLKIAKQAAIYHNVTDIINSAPVQTLPPHQVGQTVGPNDNFITPAPQEPMQAHIPPPQIDRRINSAPQMHILSQQQLDDRHPPAPIIPPEMQHNMRMMQFQQQHGPHDPHDKQFVGSQRLTNNVHTLDRAHQVIQERQVHFQPSPPTVHFEDQPSPNITNSASPLKSPKKVSWVDTQPHQSLHTLIPPSPSLVPSPEHQAPSPPLDIPEPNFHPNQDYHHQPLPPMHVGYNNGHHMAGPNQVSNGQMGPMRDEHQDDLDEEEDEDDEEDDIDSDDHLDNGMNGQTAMNTHENARSAHIQQQNDNQPHNSNGTGQLDTSAEITLDDIDKALSDTTHNNWIEDSAGVIGTQEVYNDPRQRIVKERERTNEDVNIEKLSFQEKLKMFNLTAKK